MRDECAENEEGSEDGVDDESGKEGVREEDDVD